MEALRVAEELGMEQAPGMAGDGSGRKGALPNAAPGRKMAAGMGPNGYREASG